MNFKNVFTKKEDIETYKAAGKISAEILKELSKAAQIGTTPKQINQLANELCAKYDVKPSFKGVPGPLMPFPGAICVCVNDQTLHAIPFSDIPFESGDVVKLDFGIIYKGFCTDHCVTIGLGDLSDKEKKLISTAKLCVNEAVKKAVAGNTIGDISSTLQTIADLEGFDYVTEYAGHGIGKVEDGGIHMDPSVPSFGRAGRGIELVEGLVICIENQISMGKADLRIDADGWTLSTKDGSKTAMFEHTVMVGRDKPVVLTL